MVDLGRKLRLELRPDPFCVLRGEKMEETFVKKIKKMIIKKRFKDLGPPQTGLKGNALVFGSGSRKLGKSFAEHSL